MRDSTSTIKLAATHDYFIAGGRSFVSLSPIHLKDSPRATLKSILRQAQLTVAEFTALL
jgi:hypothetical protein